MSATHKRPWIDWLIAVAIFGLALGVYNATLTPSLSYKSPDGNELVTIAYTLGLGNLARYLEIVRPDRDEWVVEDYWVVLPPQVDAGEHSLTLSLQDLFWGGETVATATIALQPIELEREDT